MCINSRFSSLFSGDMFRFKAISKSLTVFALASLISAYHRTHLDGRKHKAVPRELCCLFFFLCVCVWDIGIDTSPLFSEHEVILLMACQLCTPKFDFALQNESKKKKNPEQFIMLFVPRFTSYRLQFISYLGVLWAIFLHFSVAHFSFFFFCLDPARCWLNSCLQPWCWNITENYIIILKLVNKERQRNRFKSQGTMLHEELLTSLTQMQPLAARPLSSLRSCAGETAR